MTKVFSKNILPLKLYNNNYYMALIDTLIFALATIKNIIGATFFFFFLYIHTHIETCVCEIGSEVNLNS